MTPLEIAHAIIRNAAHEHAQDIKKQALFTNQNPELNTRRVRIRQSLGAVEQVTTTYHHVAGLIEDACLPTGVRVHPSRFLALAKRVDGYLQELGFKSMEKPIFQLLSEAHKTGSRTPHL